MPRLDLIDAYQKHPAEAKPPKAARVRRVFPSEHEEQVRVVDHIRLKKLPVAAIPNGAKRSRYERGQALDEGLESGYPDLVVDVMSSMPIEACRTRAFSLLSAGGTLKPSVRSSAYLSLRIEMKRQRLFYGKSWFQWQRHITENQKKWLWMLRGYGHAALVAYGADEGIAIFEAYREGRLILPEYLFFTKPEEARASGLTAKEVSLIEFS